MTDDARLGSVDFRKLKILAVDDEGFILRFLIRALEQLGVQHVLTAKNGKDALDILKENTDIDLIICDLEMPGMDGFAFVQTLRFHSPANICQKPVVILTGHCEIDDIQQSVDLGISGFVPKPVSSEILEKEIINALTAPFI